MAEKVDWKVRGTLDRDKLVEDIMGLVNVLKRRRLYCVVDAVDEAEAREVALRRMQRVQGVPSEYVKFLHARRLPT